MTLTESQRVWLSLAAARDGVSPEALWHGSNVRCMERLHEMGLVEKRFVLGEGNIWYITPAGRAELGKD